MSRHEALARLRGWLDRRRGIARCAICGEKLGREDLRWSEWMAGYVHVECIPALVRTLGDDAVRVWLRHGTGALFPEGHRPEWSRK